MTILPNLPNYQEPLPHVIIIFGIGIAVLVASIIVGSFAYKKIISWQRMITMLSGLLVIFGIIVSFVSIYDIEEAYSAILTAALSTMVDEGAVITEHWVDYIRSAGHYTNQAYIKLVFSNILIIAGILIFGANRLWRVLAERRKRL